MFFKRRRKEQEIDEEIRFHLEEEAEGLEAEGMAKEEARMAARRELGNATLVREETRAVWTWTLLEQLAQDCRYAFRTMAANKTFSGLAILSLALGIGANTAIFSFMDAMLLRALPVGDPESLVILSWRTPTRNFNGSNRHNNSFADPKGGYIGGFFAYPAFELLRKYDTVFATVFGYQGTGRLNLMHRGEASMAEGEYVSGDYFRGLGVRPAAGRLIGPDDDRAGAGAVAVISHGLSERRFGGPAGAQGAPILINNIPFTVIGVTPPEFFGADPNAAPEVYIPLHAVLLLRAGDKNNAAAEMFLATGYDWVVPMARLRRGVSAEQAQAAVAGPFYEWGRAVKPKLQAEQVPRLVVREGAGGLDSLRRQYSKPLFVLIGMTGLILAIACSNIANLLLARAAARRKEIAVRLSIGAGRGRIIRQLLTESVVLAGLGGVLGTAFAVWGIRGLTLLLANGRENFTLRAELNWAVLGAAAGLSVATGLLFGLAPALRATRVDLMAAMKEKPGSRTGSRRWMSGVGLGRLLVAGQIGLSLLLLAGASLFVRTLGNLQSIQLGFNRENVLLFQINARQAGHEDPEILAFYSRLRERLRGIPGVSGASASISPLLGSGTWAGPMTPVGQERRGSSHILVTAAEFFPTMQLPVTRGRAFDERDRVGTAPVVMVNEAYVKKYFGDENPLGRRVAYRGASGERMAEIVGVTANSRYGVLKGEFREIAYLPMEQDSYHPLGDMTFALRTSGDPMRHAGEVREIVRQADARIPVTDVRTQSAQIDATMNQEILFARLCTAFAGLALLIACVGLYGTMSYTMAQRTSEIGIRMALGAQRGTVIRMALGQVLGLAVAGLAVSAPAALSAAALVESLLFGVKGDDAAALAVPAAIVLAAVMVAGYVPARKAAGIDVVGALRRE